MFKKGQFSDIQKCLRSLSKASPVPSKCSLTTRKLIWRLKLPIFQHIRPICLFCCRAQTKKDRMLRTIDSKVAFWLKRCSYNVTDLLKRKAKGPDRIGNNLLVELAPSRAQVAFWLKRCSYNVTDLLKRKAKGPDRIGNNL